MGDAMKNDYNRRRTVHFPNVLEVQQQSETGNPSE